MEKCFGRAFAVIPEFFFRFSIGKVPQFCQRRNDVNVAGFLAFHCISIFFSHCLKFCYFSYLPTYPNDDVGFQARSDVFLTYLSYPLGRLGNL